MKNVEVSEIKTKTTKSISPSGSPRLKRADRKLLKLKNEKAELENNLKEFDNTKLKN